MGDKTGIEWTDATWNPVRGCSRVSPGCQHCYAERVAARFSGPGQPYEGLAEMRVKERILRRDFADGSAEFRKIEESRPRWTGKVRMVEDHLADPLRWKKPRRIFVNSMSDLFHEGLSNEQIASVFGVMAAAPQHTFQVLTKRAERMREWFGWVQGEPEQGCGALDMCGQAALEALPDHHRGYLAGDCLVEWPLPNVWIGVSVEDQKRADERIPLLLETPAAVRFVSAEPLLGPLELRRWLRVSWQCSGCRGLFGGQWQRKCPDCGREDYWTGSHAFNGRRMPRNDFAPPQSGLAVDWLICGAESGPVARPMDDAWVRALRDQCAAADTAFFYKQRLDGGRKVHLPILDGRQHVEWPRTTEGG